MPTIQLLSTDINTSVTPNVLSKSSGGSSFNFSDTNKLTYLMPTGNPVYSAQDTPLLNSFSFSYVNNPTPPNMVIEVYTSNSSLFYTATIVPDTGRGDILLPWFIFFYDLPASSLGLQKIVIYPATSVTILAGNGTNSNKLHVSVSATPGSGPFWNNQNLKNCYQVN